jgi:hypothetical protein
VPPMAVWGWCHRVSGSKRAPSFGVLRFLFWRYVFIQNISETLYFLIKTCNGRGLEAMMFFYDIFGSRVLFELMLYRINKVYDICVV